MKKLPLIAIVSSVAAFVHAEELPRPAVREEIRTKIIQAAHSLPPKKLEEGKKGEGTVIVMEPFTVVEPNRLQGLQTAIDREAQMVSAQQFSLTRGGALFKMDIGKIRVELGPMGDSTRLNACVSPGEKGPTRRQQWSSTNKVKGGIFSKDEGRVSAHGSLR